MLATLPVPTASFPAFETFDAAPLPSLVDVAPGERITTLGRPPWAHLGYLQVAGTGERVAVVAGLYWDQGDGLGTYYSANGRSYLCNLAAARSMALSDGVAIDHRLAGEHTGAVACVNYAYDPAGESRVGTGSGDV